MSAATLVLVEISPPSVPSDPYQIIVPIDPVLADAGTNTFAPTSAMQKGVAFSVTCTTENGIGPHTWSATGLPTGISINATTGVLSGTPTTQGYFEGTITAVDTGNGSVSTSTKVGFTVGGAIALTGALPQVTRLTAGYSGNLLVVGATGAVTWSQSGLPSGLTINSSTGIVSGTCSAVAGTYNVTITASDAGTGTTAATTFALTVVAAVGSVAIDGASPFPNCLAGADFKTQLSAVDSLIGFNAAGTAPFTFTATGLPTGLSIDQLTGLISGKTAPTAAGSYSITIGVTDYWGSTASRAVTLTVTAGVKAISPGRFMVGSSTDPSGFDGIDFLSQIFGDGSDGAAVLNGSNTYSWAVLAGSVYTLKRDVYLTNLTISPGVQLKTFGYKIFGTGKLSLNGCSANTIVLPTSPGNNASALGGGSGSGTTQPRTVGGSLSGGDGGSGSTAGAGTAPTQGEADADPGNGGSVGATAGAGTGGNGSVTSGSVRAGSRFSQNYTPIRTGFQLLLRGGDVIRGGAPGAGGGYGGNDGTNKGGSGGGGGGGGGVIAIFFFEIETNGSTAALCINAAGGNGGNGFCSSVNANVGGGGGGAGGGGGYVHVVYATRTGSAVANLIGADGGNGGIGATNTLNAARNGRGGDGAYGGQIVAINVFTQIVSVSAPSAAPATQLGTLAGAGAQVRLTF